MIFGTRWSDTVTWYW